MHSYYGGGFPPYVSVGKKRANALKAIKQLRKKNPDISPVTIDGKTIAKNWWGKSWNNNLERYADYSNRIGRGRSYVRHGAVLDLQLSVEKITALVQGSGSRPYNVNVNISKLSQGNLRKIMGSCHGGLDSLEELLAGQFPKSLQELFFKKDVGFFPNPKEIKFDCSCPDWASMCKHVAAVLYGVGARLDDDPSLFFKLRAIDINDFVSQSITDTTDSLLKKAKGKSNKIIEDNNLGEMFGIEFDSNELDIPKLPSVKRNKKKTAKQSKKVVAKKPVVKSKTVKNKSNATMIDYVLKSVGRAKKGKSIEEIQAKLNWTTPQVRNAITRARTKGVIELASPGYYRKKIV